MKVWVLKTTPDYEQPTEHGTFVNPAMAADKFAELVRENVLKARNALHVRLTTDAEDSGIAVVYNTYDVVSLVGVHVEGTGRVQDPSMVDRRALSQIMLDLTREAVSEYDFTGVTVADDVWVLRQSDQN